MPKIGSALKRAVELKPADSQQEPKRSSSPLMNLNRRTVFKRVCLRPCSALEDIASAVQFSRSSVTWHLDALAKSGYVDVFILGRSRIFSPAGLVSEEDAPAFAALARGSCRIVFSAILATPGADTGLLCGGLEIGQSNLRGCIATLSKAGLVAKVMDGRHARYFPAMGYNGLVASLRSNSKTCTRRLIHRMKAERLKPEIIDMKRDSVIIEITVLGNADRLEIPQRSLSLK
jgi:predicted transcriptional regulator